ncbi:MAG: hypothetical protein MI754_10470 [Chromatiales bacterium]|nr:hypothetical protein [Chromatiales bacterium]
MKSFISLCLTACLAVAAPVASADVLLIDAISENPSNSEAGLQRPRTGQSMNTVRSQFGEPRQELPWVGDPPITRWVYDHFTVYFEHEYVINTVVHRKTQQ